MSIVKDKYRGSTTDVRVMAELVLAAERKGLTTYQDIGKIMNLPMQGSHLGNQTGRILGEIAEDEVRAGRPMLSAVAVSVKGRPGPGFWGLARDMDLLKPEQSEEEFWQEQRAAAYEAWRRPLPE